MDTGAAESGSDAEAKRIDIALGAELRGLRSKRGLSQDELAKASGISKRTIVRLESGERPMGMDQLYKLCRALRIKPSQLINAVEAEVGIE
ncbi:helix-turn-helix transcriptional regulator [Nocardia sp. NPDC050793]|uniref:helix-turn-helix domain-containing protein n=1 Tax=Nocardia sp. NPDC050793 TaxID=3155159 RepID=UPI0033E4B190